MFLLMLELIDLKHTRRCKQHLITLGLEHICILIEQKWIRKRTGLSAGRPSILTRQGSICQRTYRSPRGQASEASYRDEEVLKVGTSGSSQCKVPFRHSRASITNPAEHGETHPPPQPWQRMQKSALIPLDMQIIALSHIKIMSFFNYRAEREKSCGLGAGRHFLNKNRGARRVFQFAGNP